MGSPNDIMSSIGSSNRMSLLPCRINKVNEDNLTADVYIQDNSNILYNIPICFPSRGKGYGSYFMPTVGATYLLIYTNKGKPYVLAQAPINRSNDNFTSSEKITAGENLVQSIGNAYSKQDKVGNNILSSSFGNNIILRKNGVNSFYSNGKEEETIASKNITGFGIDLNTLANTEALNNGEIKLIDYSEYYQSISNIRIYKIEDILDITGEINQSIKNTILTNAQETIEKINGDNGFKIRMSQYKEQIQNTTLTDDELSNLITTIFNEIKTNFNIEKKGVKIIIEKGNAINKEIENINDVLKLKSTDFIKSEQNNDICLRMTMKDITTDTIKAVVSLDTEGNCKFKFKTLKIEVEQGGYSLVEE